MQVLARLNTPVPTPIADNELTTRGFVETWELPVVKRIHFTFPAGSNGQDSAVASLQQAGTVWIDLDKGAPADCYVQWWRTRPASDVGQWHGAGFGNPPSTRRGVAGWRPLGWSQAVWVTTPPQPRWLQGNAADMPDIAIPQGTTRVQLGLMTRLFRPWAKPIGSGATTYSRYYREVLWPQANNELPPWMAQRGARNATKAVFKIGVMRRWRDAAPPNHFHLEQGPMSIETLIIQRWRFTADYRGRQGGAGTPPIWALKADVV